MKAYMDQHYQFRQLTCPDLIEQGIQRGEIIIIYAYRSVASVISPIGRIISTQSSKESDDLRCAEDRDYFQRHRSCIDPAYPSDRQIVYVST